MGQAQFTIITGPADEVVIHKFYRRRIESGLYQFRHQGRRPGKIRKDSQHVQLVRAERHQLECDLGNDAQRTFRPDNQLVQAISGRAFF